MGSKWNEVEVEASGNRPGEKEEVRREKNFTEEGGKESSAHIGEDSRAN
jgi:hypothetical protein